MHSGIPLSVRGHTACACDDMRVSSPQLTGTLGLAVSKRAAAAVDLIRRPESGLVVLIYHRVGRRTDSRVDLPVWLFEEQVARLTAESRVTDLDRGLNELEVAGRPDRQALVLTFDDGTADFVDLALPILVRYGAPATLYVATDFVESSKCFPGGAQPVSWAGLRDALGTGLVTIGSHTHRHLLLDRVDERTAVEDLDRSIALIEDRLGTGVRHFAYPKAIVGSPVVERAVQSRFRSAAVAGTRSNLYGRFDPYRLARSPIQKEDGLRFFERKVRGGMGLEDQLRHLLNRRRLTGRET